MIQNGISRFFLFQKGFGTEFRGFSHPKMVWNGILSVFLFRETLRNRIPRVFLFREMVRNKIPRVFSSKKWFGTEFWGFFLPRNGLELNSEVFLFCETGGIPTELPSVPSCPPFHGIIFCQKMATLIHGESWLPVGNTLGNLDHL
jgi:hypothetical protein